MADLYEEQLVEFFYSDMGLEFADAPHTKKQNADEVSRNFYDAEGNIYVTFDELKSAFAEGKPVFAYKAGSVDPYEVKLDGENLSLGKNFNDLGPKKKAPGFWNRFLAIFGNKKAKAVCQEYDQYKKDLAQQKVLQEKNGNTRSLNIEKEEHNKKMAHAKETHEAQKAKILNEMQKSKKDFSIEHFESINRWERAGFPEFCRKVSLHYRAADPKYNDWEREEYLNQKIEDGTALAQEMEAEGKRIIKNAIIAWKSAKDNHLDAPNIFEAMVGKFVTGKTTDLEEKQLDDFFKLSYVDKYYVDEKEYEDANFDMVANPKNEIDGDYLFNDAAQLMFGTTDPNTKYKLTDAKAMLAIAAYKIPLSNEKKNSQLTSLGETGKLLNQYQITYNHFVDCPDDEKISIDPGTLRTIAKVQVLQHSLSKQTMDGENDIQRLLKDDSIAYSNPDNKYVKNKYITGDELLEGCLQQCYIKTTLNTKGIKAFAPINKEQLIQFLGDESNNKLAAKGLMDGLKQLYSKADIKAGQLESIKDVDKEIEQEVEPEIKTNNEPTGMMM